jgi:transglycosylase-like protein
MGHGGQLDVRYLLPTSLALALVTAVALVGSAGRATAGAGSSRAKASGSSIAIVDYRRLTWTYDRIAPPRRVFSTTRSAPTRGAKTAAAKGAALRSKAKPLSLLALWKERADAARRAALATLGRTVGIRFPAAPSPKASPAGQRAYYERLDLVLERIVPAPDPSRALASARPVVRTLTFWQLRAAAAAVAVARYAPRPLFTRDQLLSELLCIHHYEGKWTSNTGNGYYGGMQMDLKFQHTYGGTYYALWGTADNWPVWAQVIVARRAYLDGRGFTPWPNTAHVCGLR